MLTRQGVTHSYAPNYGGLIRRDGAVRVAWVKNLPQTWAITRPSTSPDPTGAPFYVNRDPGNSLERGGILPLSMARPLVEMDPSNQSTWQRPYLFT